jgi:hypothetical protein
MKYQKKNITKVQFDTYMLIIKKYHEKTVTEVWVDYISYMLILKNINLSKQCKSI